VDLIRYHKESPEKRQRRRELHKIYARTWYAQKVKPDANRYLRLMLRNRIRTVLRGKEKSGRSLDLLGCDIPTWRRWLEDQFEPGMTWENYGTDWHVDHRIPLSTLDLRDPENQRYLFNYQNTRPMCGVENVSRGNHLVLEDLLG
jgi:hypothetical protein